MKQRISSSKPRPAWPTLLSKASARNLRKEHPKLTPEQAFAKVYEDPANIGLRKAERAGAYWKLYPPVARMEPLVEYGNSNDTGLAALKNGPPSSAATIRR